MRARLMDGSCQLKLKPCWGPSVTTERQRATEKGLITVYGAGGPAGAAPAYWVTSDDSVMIFDNLIEADFISQSVYNYTGARPNTLPSSHMRHGHAEHAAVGRTAC
jgi:hypothetical protein